MSENFTKLVESFYGSTIGNVRSRFGCAVWNGEEVTTRKFQF